MHRILLMRLGLLEALSEEHVSLVRECLRRRRILSGETLFVRGETCEHLWLIEEGSVRVLADQGESRRTLEILGAGNILPDHGVFLGTPYPFTVEGAEEALILSLHRDDLRQLTDSVPGFGWQLLRLLSRRLVEMQARIAALSSPDARGRIGAVLLLLAQQNTPTRAQLPVTLRLRQTEIAQMAGVARETVSRILTEWSRTGLVIVGRGQLTLVDIGRLQVILEDDMIHKETL